MGAAAGVAAIGAVIAAVVIASPWRAGAGPIEALPHQPSASSNAGRAEVSTPGVSAPKGTSGAAKGATAESGASTSAGAASKRAGFRAGWWWSGIGARTGAAAGGLDHPGRDPNDVQETADRVSPLAVSDGGFVQSSRVQTQQTGTSEANLMLSIPSAKLSGALASLGQLRPVRAESQPLQDITNTYDAARQRLVLDTL